MGYIVTGRCKCKDEICFYIGRGQSDDKGSEFFHNAYMGKLGPAWYKGVIDHMGGGFDITRKVYLCDNCLNWDTDYDGSYYSALIVRSQQKYMDMDIGINLRHEI